MKKKLIIAVVVSLIVGVGIGVLIGLAVNSNKMEGTVTDTNTTVKRVIDEAKIFACDDHDRKTDQVIGHYKRIVLIEELPNLEDPDHPYQRIISEKVDFKFKVSEGSHRICYFPIVDGKRDYQNIQIAHSDENTVGTITLTYLPMTEEELEFKTEVNYDLFEYELEFDTFDACVGDITTTVY